ncbi:MAG TPA: YegS/Rv2252/BmrU family lipid kinase [Flavisolibacter sp.]|nr:YegS/Rv2252/BmrU family lipid kinase [Flavisolibacter sp.]
MKRKLLYLVNPISGAKNKHALEETIRSRTAARGLAYAIYPTVAGGDYDFAAGFIRDEGFTDVIIAGGDGTINQVLNSLRHTGVTFGIIPCGSGNGLAFSAGLPKNKDKALDIIFEGASRSTDAFTINERFACMLCGLGFDAQVAHDFANDARRGLSTYIKKTISNFFSAPAYPFGLLVNGRRIETEAYFISIANSNQFGNHFTIAPKASLTDGLLDIVIMTKQSKLSVLLQALRQVGGYNRLQEVDVLNEKAGVIYFQAESLKVSNPFPAPMHIDGDPAETAEAVNIRLLKDCFRLIYPS